MHVSWPAFHGTPAYRVSTDDRVLSIVLKLPSRTINKSWWYYQAAGRGPYNGALNMRTRSRMTRGLQLLFSFVMCLGLPVRWSCLFHFPCSKNWPEIFVFSAASICNRLADALRFAYLDFLVNKSDKKQTDMALYGVVSISEGCRRRSANQTRWCSTDGAICDTFRVLHKGLEHPFAKCLNHNNGRTIQRPHLLCGAILMSDSKTGKILFDYSLPWMDRNCCYPCHYHCHCHHYQPLPLPPVSGFILFFTFNFVSTDSISL